MKTRIVFYLPLTIATVLTLAALAHAQLAKKPQRVEDAVLARLGEIENAAEKLDSEKVFSFVLENNHGALVQNGRIFLTRTDALENTKQGFQRLEKVHYALGPQHVTMLAPTVALVIGQGASEATTLDGRSLTTQFAQSVVLVHTNGEWKVIHAHRSFSSAR
ncbi:MAG TPA: nuclear transport factor 2 family protein [Candidatus Limnocylindrales bacterium]|jgi:hypothetical protein|nr:nuclear transport factor 2 family protein [Candidatus Limnocylindrales bacterium]